ncbi:MAG: S1C family serine protease [Nocardioides sp.]
MLEDMNEHLPPQDQMPAATPPPYPSYEHTHRFAQPGFGNPAPREVSRPSKGVVAGILTAALVVGGLGGLAGAAGFNVVDGLVEGDSAPASPSTSPTTSTVSDTKDTPAANGSAEKVAAEVLPSVVKITVISPQGSGSGSGIILSSDGEILTNNHVAEGAQGGRMTVSFNDGTTAPATIVGTDPLTDLAVIKARGVSGLDPATLGHSDQLDVGEGVVAIGSPFGLDATVTTGIVSALHRPVSVGDTQGTATTYPAIQTDAAINPGNSGGPLVNMRGEVVGINSSIRTAATTSGQAGSIGLGFAIPIDNVLPVVDQLENGQTPTHARLGVGVVDATSKNGLVTGAGIERVDPNSAAADAGLERGDVVTKVDDIVITGYQSLVATIRGHRPGDQVTLTVVHAGSGDKTETVTATLGSDAGNATS